MRLLFLVLLLAGCSSGPSVYRQGIPIAPGAPAFNPATDSPVTTGQPGYVGPAEQIPRTPHGRVLPQTPTTRREPGLWAGDAPQASMPWVDREPIILGTVLPEPNDDLLVRTQIRRCAYLADALFDVRMHPHDRIAEGRDMRACLAAHAWRHCAVSDLADLDRARTKGVISLRMIEAALRRDLQRAEDFVRQQCRDDMGDNEWLIHWKDDLTNQWERFNTRGSR